jgi:hypothetical protein
MAAVPQYNVYKMYLSSLLSVKTSEATDVKSGAVKPTAQNTSGAASCSSEAHDASSL